MITVQWGEGVNMDDGRDNQTSSSFTNTKVDRCTGANMPGVPKNNPIVFFLHYFYKQNETNYWQNTVTWSPPSDVL